MSEFNYRLKNSAILVSNNYEEIFPANFISKLNHTEILCNALPAFLNRQEAAYKYELSGSSYDENAKVTISQYLLYSQTWPLNVKEQFGSNIWKHQLTIYKPDVVSYNTAFLYTNGGFNFDSNGEEKFSEPKQSLLLAEIATANHVVTAELKQVPNQFLHFEDESKPRKEDAILSYTYKKILESPLEYSSLAGHLPMAKAIVKAMDAMEGILLEQQNDRNGVTIDDFILAGLSKRAWAIWLAAIGDERVKSIIPGVIDILNLQENIKHISKSYGGECPPALYDYVADGVIKDNIDTEGWLELAQIEDPYKYLFCPSTQGKRYIERLSIPKYIINSSGDDFSVPDSSRKYFSQLPGESNLLRYLPNSSHFADPVIISKSASAYIHILLNNIPYPHLNWSFTDEGISVTSSIAPKYAKLWLAMNEESRDFRFRDYSSDTKKAGNVKYLDTALTYDCREESFCSVKAKIPYPESGWQASFIEVGFDLAGNELVLTSEVRVVPDLYPLSETI